MAVVECGIRENLAEYYGQKSAPARLEGVGREAGQTPIFFAQARNWELNEGLDSQHDSGVDAMKRISNTKASRTANQAHLIPEHDLSRRIARFSWHNHIESRRKSRALPARR